MWRSAGLMVSLGRHCPPWPGEEVRNTAAGQGAVRHGWANQISLSNVTFHIVEPPYTIMRALLHTVIYSGVCVCSWPAAECHSSRGSWPSLVLSWTVAPCPQRGRCWYLNSTQGSNLLSPQSAQQGHVRSHCRSAHEYTIIISDLTALMLIIDHMLFIYLFFPLRSCRWRCLRCRTWPETLKRAPAHCYASLKLPACTSFSQSECRFLFLLEWLVLHHVHFFLGNCLIIKLSRS